MLPTLQNESLRTTDSGFAVTQPTGRDRFRDEDVIGLCVENRRQCDAMGNIVLHEVLRIRVIDQAGDRWITMSAEVGPWDRNPLKAVRKRLLDSLVERSCEVLLSAGDVHGAGWSLSLIYFHDTTSGRSCPPQEISAVRWTGDQLCLYNEDEHAPFACYERSEENTVLLGALLEHVVEGVQTSSDKLSNRGLGNLTYEVYATESRWLTPSRAAVLASVPVAVMFLVLPLWAAVVGVLLLMMIGLAARPILSDTPASLRLYDRAIAWTRGDSERLLLLDDVDTMTASHFDQKRTDGSTAPKLRITYRSRSRAQEPIEFSSLLTPANRDQMETILIASAKLIASQMRISLEKDGFATWTPGLSIRPDTITYHQPDTNRPQLIHREDVQGWSLSDTKMMLALTNGDAITIATSKPNFYPGFMLLHELKWFKTSRG